MWPGDETFRAWGEAKIVLDLNMASKDHNLSEKKSRFQDGERLDLNDSGFIQDTDTEQGHLPFTCEGNSRAAEGLLHFNAIQSPFSSLGSNGANACGVEAQEGEDLSDTLTQCQSTDCARTIADLKHRVLELTVDKSDLTRQLYESEHKCYCRQISEEHKAGEYRELQEDLNNTKRCQRVREAEESKSKRMKLMDERQASDSAKILQNPKGNLIEADVENQDVNLRGSSHRDWSTTEPKQTHFVHRREINRNMTTGVIVRHERINRNDNNRRFSANF